MTRMVHTSQDLAPEQQPLLEASWHACFGLTCLMLLVGSGGSAAQSTDGRAAAATQSSPAGDGAVDEVIVTGSRIRGAAAIGSSVIAIDAAGIAESARANSSELLRLVPQVSNLGADDSRVNGTQRAQANIFAASAINLRGVGPEATLVLLDGRRPGRSDSGRFFDVNTIPAIALQRVEVVADGASAIYGSDAVAGVVNLIPYRRYQGISARLSAGEADDLDQRTYSVLAGGSWGRASAVFALEHNFRDNLLATARPGAFDDSRNTAGGVGTSTNAFPGNITVAGVLRPAVDTNGDGRLSLAEYTAAVGRLPNRLSNWTGVDALPEQERDSVFGHFELELGSRARFYAQGHLSHRRFTRLSASPTAALTIPTTNFYNQTGLPLSVQYSFINDSGSARSEGYDKPQQLALGLNYDLGKRWQAETYVIASEADTYRFNDNVVNTTALTGSGVLSDPTPAAFSPFGGANQAATLGRILGFSTNSLSFSMRNAALKVDGPLFALPGGEVRMAAGVEYLREARESTNTNNTAGADVNTLIVANYPTVTRTVESAYVEVLLPIVSAENARRGLEQLSLSIAGRADRYFDRTPSATQLDADTFNPKFGLTWQPVEWLRVRSSFGKSFRAPSLGDYSLGPPTFSASGSFAGMSHAAALPLPAGTVNGVSIQGGRTDGRLKPERARTTSLGVEFTPSRANGLHASLTYYRLKYENQIVSAASPGALNNAEYANALAAAGLLTFNPTTAQVLDYLNYGGFPLVSVIGPRNVYGTGSGPSAGRTIPVAVLMDLRSVNTGLVETDGFDFTLRYALQTARGNWRFTSSSTYVLSSKQSLLTGTPITEYVNTYGYPVRFRTRSQIGFDRGAIDANLFVDFVNSYENTQVSPTVSVGSFTVIDFNVGYSFGKRIAETGQGRYSVRLNAQNLLDREPPYALSGSPAQTYDSQNASVIGRLLTLSVGARF